MHNLKKLIVALDLSKTDEQILGFLKKFTEALLPDKILFFHAVPDIALPEDVFASPEEKEEYIEQRLSDCKQQLDGLREEYFGHRSDIHFEIECRYGSPLRRLLDSVEERHPDLVVFGKKKMTGGSGILATKLARRISCNLLLVPENSEQHLPIKRVLVPTDFSSHATKALSMAVELHALLKDPQLIIMHAYNVPPSLPTRIGRTPEQFGEMIKAHVMVALNEFVEHNVPAHIEPVLDMVEIADLGPAKQILHSVQQHNADMLIIGAEGHTLLESLFLGSVTEKLLQVNEGIPVLVIRG